MAKSSVNAVKESPEPPQTVTGSNEKQADPAQTKNSPPVITNIKLLPEVFKPGDLLNVDVSASDADNDTVTILYEWTKNGEPAGNGKNINGPIKRGDKISIKVTPFDGKAYGNPVILHREILNLPPVIIEDNKFNFDGRILTYQVRASDPDGDVLTYSLKAAPQDMSIDALTGLIKWNVPPDFKGDAQAAVSVTDGHKGEALYPLKITIGN